MKRSEINVALAWTKDILARSNIRLPEFADNTDNFFLEPVARFADIDEDEPVLHPLCNEYGALV